MSKTLFLDSESSSLDPRIVVGVAAVVAAKSTFLGEYGFLRFA